MQTQEIASQTRDGLDIRVPHALIVEDDITQEPLWESIISKVSPRATFTWVEDQGMADVLLQEHVKQGPIYDVVISDIFLSGIKTGFDLWESYAQFFPGRFILTSGIDYGKFSRSLSQTHAPPLYLRKPLNFSECIEAIHYAIASRHRWQAKGTA